MAGEVLSNVVGAPFDQYVIDQLNTRAANNSSQTRDDKQLLFLANKMSWSRLTSSVRINPKDVTLTEFYRNLFEGETPPGDYSSAESLAKNWILEAGTSIYNNGSYSLRSGLGPNGAYGLGGLQQGFRPMPGIESMTIESKGVLGSLREANITFKVWNLTQLNVIEALYFRLGYTMLLEWGHVNYFNNKGTFVTDNGGIDLFTMKSKEQLLQNITKRSKQTDGNYEAMLGTVTNFYFSFNQDGGYDCNLKLVGLGSVIDTIRINQVYIMPEVLAQQVQQQKDLIQANIEKEKKRLADIAARNERGGKEPFTTLPPAVKLPSDIATIYKVDTGQTLPNLGLVTYPKVSLVAAGANNTLSDYYYKAVGSNPTYLSSELATKLNDSRAGLYLAVDSKRSKFQFIPANVTPDYPQPVTLFAGNINYYGNTDRKGTAQERRELLTAGGFQQEGIFELNNNGAISSKANKASNYAVEIIDSEVLSQAVDISKPITKPVIVNFFYTANVLSPDGTNSQVRLYVIQFVYDPTGINQANVLTRGELATALDLWFNNSKAVNLTEITSFRSGIYSYVKAVGTLTGLYAANKATPTITIAFNDTALIDSVLPRPTKQTVVPNTITQTANPQGDTAGGQNETSSDQGQEINKYESALHAMLTAVLSEGWSKALDAPQTQAVVPVDLKPTTTLFYQSGIMKNVFSTIANRPAAARTGGAFGYSSIQETTAFDLTRYAIKGFNSNIMADQTKYKSVTDVDFDSLCTSYLLKYDFSEGDTIQQAAGQYPVYIKFGYLLAFLNNMCTLYETQDSKNNAEIKPYVYIDYHPDYNFCLTNPQHLTIDPYKVLIPLQCSDAQYYQLFPLEVRDALKDVIFKPETQNTVSTFIGKFKTDNPYQGKTMEILLNCQYLLDLANSYLKTNNEGAVILKPFLDRIVDDINKSTGGFNLFRVAYRDDSNTVIIKDDQFVPSLANEPSILPQQYYFANKRYAELPVYASGSIAREMEFKTNMSTKMSSMIAISAQAGKSVVNSTDATPIGTYNDNYQDAFMNIKVNSANQGSSTTTATQSEAQKILNTNVEIAKKFNAHVTSVYYTGFVYKGQVDSSTTYYIDRQRTRKAEDPVTSAAPFIPANISITVDGISGIVMGNAFTIPENRLPATYKGRDLQTKVGFVVVGLSHALENNQWLTKIRGQMIRLRDSVSYGKVSKVGSLEGNVTKVFTARVVDLTSIDLNADWLSIAFAFVASKEGYIATPKWDYTRYRAGYGSDVLVQANGAEVEVTQSTVFTQADAERTLKIVLAGTYANGVINQIGKDKWNALSNTQKAALVSYAYNAGAGALDSWGITKAIKSNSTTQQIAALIKRGPITATDTRTKKTETLQALIDRRAAEAQLYLS